MSPNRKGTQIVVDSFIRLESKCKLLLHLQQPVELFPKLQESINQGGERIQVVSQTVGPPGLYHMADVYVYPTTLEGIGLTICEALACGLPVITTRSPPMTEFIKHLVTGYTCRVAEFRGRQDGYYWAESHCSAESVKRGMKYFVDRASELNSYAAAARNSAERHFNQWSNFSELPEILENALRSGPRKLSDWEHLVEAILRTATVPFSRLLLRGTSARLLPMAWRKFGYLICS